GFFFSSRRRHTRFSRDWSSDVCSSDLASEWRTARRMFLPGGFLLDGAGRSGRQRQTVEVARVVGHQLDAVLGDAHGVGVAEAADLRYVQPWLDGKDHPRLEYRLVAGVEEWPFVVAQADGVACV